MYSAYDDRSTHTSATLGERLYRAYAVTLVGGLVGWPIIRAVWTVLQDDAVANAVASPRGADVVGLVGIAALAVVLALGRVRGPVVARPFLALVLSATSLPRQQSLRRPFVRAALGVTLVAACSAGGILAAIAPIAGTDASAATLAVVSTVSTGALLAVAWLGSQTASGRTAWILPVVAAATLILALAVPNSVQALPGGWMAAAWPDSTSVDVVDTVSTGLLALGALAGVLFAPRLLERLDGSDVVRQSLRWEATTSVAMVGDLQGAMAQLRMPPVLGRGHDLVRGRAFLPAVMASDAVSVLRSPVRAAFAAVTLVVSGVLVGHGAAASDAGVLVLVAAALGVFAGLGPLTDGPQHAVQTMAGPRLYGVRDGTLMVAHALAPTAVGVVLVALPAALSGGSGHALRVALGTCVLVVVLVLVRVNDAAKGMPPAALAIPMVTPLGDLSIIARLVWQFDAVVLAGLAGAGVAAVVAGSDSLLGAAAIGIGVVLVVLQIRSRLRALSTD